MSLSKTRLNGWFGRTVTPEQFGEWWDNPKFLTKVHGVCLHHWLNLPIRIRRRHIQEDFEADVIGEVFAVCLRRDIKTRTGFEHFCLAAARMHCRVRRKYFLYPSRFAPEIAIDDDSLRIQIHAKPDDGGYPEDETGWAWTIMVQRGLKPRPESVKCFHCSDPAKKNAGNGNPGVFGPRRLVCADPRCKQWRSILQSREHRARKRARVLASS